MPESIQKLCHQLVQLVNGMQDLSIKYAHSICFIKDITVCLTYCSVSPNILLLYCSNITLPSFHIIPCADTNMVPYTALQPHLFAAL